MLKNKAVGEGISIIDGGTKIWEVQKQYRNADLANDSSCLGYKIDVYQESINKLFPEYLVNFDFLNRLMTNYGFELVPREEAQHLGLPEGSGLFGELFNEMLDEIKKNKFKKKEYGQAPEMNAFERKISFLNRYFVYKKLRTVNAEKVVNEMLEETFEERSFPQPQPKNVSKSRVKKSGQEVVTSMQKKKPVKLARKLVLVEATEAQDEDAPQEVEEVIVIKPKGKKATKSKPKLIIMDE
jgi:hypothetical protein